MPLAGRSKPHVLLVDFGLAEIFDEQAALGGPATVKGSPAYLSPEGFDGKLTQKSDTWALGVMLFEMLVGTRPFRGTNNIFVLYCQVANTEPAFDKNTTGCLLPGSFPHGQESAESNVGQTML